MLTLAGGTVTIEPVTSLIDALVDADKEPVILALDAEIHRLKAKFDLLVAIRGQLQPYEEDSEETDESAEELPLAEVNDLPCVRTDIITGDPAEAELANQIATYVLRHGASKPGDIATALSVHSTKIGRVAAKCGSLEKRYITGKGNCIVLKD